jgi:hypothetical protein
MYGDDYKPENQDKYDQVCKSFVSCETKDDLSKMLMLYLMDMSFPRQDLHVAHKRACLQKGWE